MEKTYSGSCHCQRVKFEVNLDLSKGTGRCNCSFCAKVRNWSAIVRPENFRLLTGEKEIADYQFSSESPNHHHFCKHCGVRTHTRGYVEEIGGAYVSVSIPTLNNINPEELAELPVTYMDGLHNNWFHPPKIFKHL